MAADPAYLDHNATTPPFPQVIELVAEVMAEAGNPSAVYAQGRRATQRLETARRQVAALSKARARDVIFFGSATEANATLIQHFSAIPFLRPDTEHDAVLAARSGQTLALNSQGTVDLDLLAARLAQQEGPILLAIMAANNETGVVSDLSGIAALLKDARAQGLDLHYHIDAVQAPGKLPIDFAAWGCDSLALSAHKFGGPQGVGALITRPGFDLRPLIRGGGQERRRRAGTENVAGIAGFGLACDLVSQGTSTLRDRLEAGLLTANPEATIVGKAAPRLPNTTCLLTPGKAAETLLMQFDLAGVALSSGSACSSGKIGKSHVLAAMGLAPEISKSALRFSCGPKTTVDEVDRAIKVYGEACR